MNEFTALNRIRTQGTTSNLQGPVELPGRLSEDENGPPGCLGRVWANYSYCLPCAGSFLVFGLTVAYVPGAVLVPFFGILIGMACLLELAPPLSSSYLNELSEWENSASDDRRCYYAAVANNIRCSKLHKDSAIVLVDCQGLDSLPPLPTQFECIQLVLKGEFNGALRTSIAHLPAQVPSLTFCDNAAITEFSSALISPHVRGLHIKNCPNFTHFFGRFAIYDLELSNTGCQSLFLSGRIFPNIRSLVLQDNPNLALIKPDDDFSLRGSAILGDHNKLGGLPNFRFPTKLNPSGLASISDYSFLDNRSQWNGDALALMRNHHEQGRVAATHKLIKTAEYIFARSGRSEKSFARRCLEALIDNSTISFDFPEVILGKLFLEGKLITGDYQKAQKFFQLAVDREQNPAQKEAVERAIESLVLQHFYQLYQKVCLWARQDASIPLELLQLIFSAAVTATTAPRAPLKLAGSAPEGT